MPEFEFDEAHAPKGCFDRKGDIDVGDTFVHIPSGNELECAGVDGKDVYWSGWPYGYHHRANCLPSKEADDDFRRELLITISEMQPDRGAHDMRRVLARRRLGITAREEAAAQRSQRIEALLLLVRDARSRAPGATAELFRAARLLARKDEAEEAIGSLLGTPS